MELLKLLNIQKTPKSYSEELMSNIISFSILPDDKDAQSEVQKLKDYSRKTGITFSFLVLKAVKELNRELKL